MPTLTIEIPTAQISRIQAAYGVTTMAEFKAYVISGIKTKVIQSEQAPVEQAEDAKIVAAEEAKDAAIVAKQVEVATDIVLS